jgi:hypothetical protein
MDPTKDYVDEHIQKVIAESSVGNEIITYETYTIAKFTFDGYEYYLYSYQHLFPYLYLAKKARAGDADAAEILTAGKVTLIDSRNRKYWPADRPDDESVLQQDK